MNWQGLLPDKKQDMAQHLTLERVHMDRAGTRMLISMLSDKLCEEEEFLCLKEAFQRAFRPLRVSLRVASPSLKEDFMRNAPAYAGFLTHCLARTSPGIRPMLAHATWLFEGGRLILSVESAACKDYLEEVQLPSRLSTFLKDVFRLEAPVLLQEMEDQAEQIKRLDTLRSQTEQVLMAHAVEAKKEPKPKKPNIKVMGMQIADPVLPINELTQESGKVTLCGEVLSAESRELRGGEMKLLTFYLTDLTGTMPCKAFLRYRRRNAEPGEPTPEEIARVEGIISAVTAGAYFKVRGECQWDSYRNEVCLMINDINLAIKPVRRDDAPEKRVELHLHTQMSSMDGLASVESLIRQAAQWGHPAIAVTDHGVVQAFPDAFAAAKKHKIKLIPGVEGYLTDATDVVSRGDDRDFDQDLVMLDLHTTGPSVKRDRIVEICGVRIRRGQIMMEYSTRIQPGMPLDAKAIKDTGLEDSMLWDAKPFEEILPDLLDFLGDAALASHNAQTCEAFLAAELARCGKDLPLPLVDTQALARRLYPSLKSFRLGAVCKHLGISRKDVHSLVQEVRAGAKALLRMLSDAAAQGHSTIAALNSLPTGTVIGQRHHIILLATSQDGITNINRLISEGFLKHYYRFPHMPKQLIQKHREGILVGSACEAGELFQAIVAGKDDETLEEIASFYDYLEIQPLGNNAFMVRNGIAADEEELRNYNRKIIALGERLNKPVVATGDVHFLNPEDAQLRAILMAGKGFEDADEQAPLYLRTTQDMLEEFAYLGKDKAHEVVIANPQAIADQVGEIHLFPPHPEGKETFQPLWPDAADNIRNSTLGEAQRIYGNPLPEIVQKRVDKELGAIIGYGFATLYNIAQKLVAKSMEDGYQVGSRGSVGSSFVATMCGITEVNPLPPHYVCPKCQHSHFDEKHEIAAVGPDMPKADCPCCGTAYLRDGYDIPFEIFLGFKGDKVPDIDLNFSGEYQPKAHKYVETLFGAENVFRAGTIGTLAEKTAFGYVHKYFEERNLIVSDAEKLRLAKGCEGVKRTTGQHPGGMVVLPENYEIYQFTAIQHPAEDTSSETITTHYDFGSMHDVLVKLDILGHDDPTMLRMLGQLTGVDALTLPLDDPQVLSLFTSPDALGIDADTLGCNTGTLGIPEFGTHFVRQMLEETQPKNMDGLIRISGLSHGTDVWAGNAQELVRNGIAKLNECICTREDIMSYLLSYGVETKMAFDIMESVRKGRGMRPDMVEAVEASTAPPWILDSLHKIKYMFPMGHAVAYVTTALRIAYYKLYHPPAYYATYFTVRADSFDGPQMAQPIQALRATLVQLNEDRQKLTAKDKELITLLELALEMNLRGVHFLPIDLDRSDASAFRLIDGNLLPPFRAIPGLGQNVAQAIIDERARQPFLSVEDLRARTRVPVTALDIMRTQGCFRNLPETSQVTLF